MSNTKKVTISLTPEQQEKARSLSKCSIIKNKEIMTTKKTAIGQLKSKVTKQCTICGCFTRRNLTADVYENTPTEIERAKQKIKEKV